MGSRLAKNDVIGSIASPIIDSSRLTSTNRPCPVRPRSTNALRTPIVA